jgi:hypothetical protein
MDVAKAFTFITDDERWVGKIAIGAFVSLLTFLIIPIVLLAGYIVGITRNVMNAEARPLPEWEDFETLFRDGLAIIVAQLVYTLPFWVLACIAFVATIGFSGLSETSSDAATAGIVATYGLVGCLALLFLVALFFLSPAIVIQYVRTDDFGAAFRISEVVAIARENIGDILIAALASFVASLLLNTVVGFLFVFVPCIGWIAGTVLGLAGAPWLISVTGHLYGQIAAKGGKQGEFA